MSPTVLNEAIPYYEETLQVTPDHFLGRRFLGAALIEVEDFDRGVAEVERALELSGVSPVFWATLDTPTVTPAGSTKPAL